MTAKTFDTPTSCATASSWTRLNVAYAHDLAGRPTSALYPNQSGAPGVTWAYDAAGRRIGETTNGRALAFTYDSDDNPATMTWPDGVQMTYGFDAADRFSSVGAGGAGGASVSAGYDSLSRMTSVVHGGVSTTVGYDAADRMASLAHAFTGGIGNQSWNPIYYYKARVYDPVSGRFLQTDPVGYGPDPDWYAYVGDDPINKSDPTGDDGTLETTPPPPPPPPGPRPAPTGSRLAGSSGADVVGSYGAGHASARTRRGAEQVANAPRSHRPSITPTLERRLLLRR